MVSPAPQANTRATASPGPGVGSGTVSSTKGVAGAFSSIAFIANLHVGSESYTSISAVPACRRQPPRGLGYILDTPQDRRLHECSYPPGGKKPHRIRRR